MPDATAELLHRSATGDRSAFADFYDATAHDAHRLALLMVGDPAGADQAVVEAYETAWRRSGDYDETHPSGRTWLLAIVREKATERPLATRLTSRWRTGQRGWRALGRGPA